MAEKPKNFSQAIDELEDSVKRMRPHFEDISQRVGDEAKRAKDNLEDQVQKNPWAAIGVIGLIFFVLGFLFASRGPGKRD